MTDPYDDTYEGDETELGRLLDAVDDAAADSDPAVIDALREALAHAVGMLAERGVDIPRD